MPLFPHQYASAPSSLAYWSASWYFSSASSRVWPRMGVIEAKTLMERGSRPTSAALARMALTRGATMSGVRPTTKIPSACVAPNWIPALGVVRGARVRVYFQ